MTDTIEAEPLVLTDPAKLHPLARLDWSGNGLSVPIEVELPGLTDPTEAYPFAGLDLAGGGFADPRSKATWIDKPNNKRTHLLVWIGMLI